MAGCFETGPSGEGLRPTVSIMSEYLGQSPPPALNDSREVTRRLSGEHENGYRGEEYCGEDLMMSLSRARAQKGVVRTACFQ